LLSLSCCSLPPLFLTLFSLSPLVSFHFHKAIEGCRVALGPGVIMMYTLQGLFHPARRVREVYWKLYNNIYIYCTDALTAYYPRLTDDGINAYGRTHLEMVL